MPAFPCLGRNCDRTFDSWRRRRDHHAIAHPADEFPQTPRYAARLKNRGRYTESCEQCGKLYVDRAGLLRHVALKHPSAPRHRCPHCDADFARPDLLTRHLKSQHPKAAGSAHFDFSCPHCGEGNFGRRQHLERHLRIAHPDAAAAGEEPAGPRAAAGAVVPLSRSDRKRSRPARRDAASSSSRRPYSTPSPAPPAPRRPRPPADDKFPFPCELCDQRFKSRKAQRAHRKRHGSGYDERQRKLAERAAMVREKKQLLLEHDLIHERMEEMKQREEERDDRDRAEQMDKLERALAATTMMTEEEEPLPDFERRDDDDASFFGLIELVSSGSVPSASLGVTATQDNFRFSEKAKRLASTPVREICI